jgi:L-seryl-tRNA(Ser) seleniumtransferase
MTESKFRALPSVDKVLGQPAVEALLESHPHELVVGLVRRRLDNARDLIGAGKKAPTLDEVAGAVVRQAVGLSTPGPHPVLNASGVILHTNLGRAPISRTAIEAMAEASLGYADLEVDLASGSRGTRNVHIEALLCQLTGAEAALVVNNNAAAVLLGLTALAKRREVIVSRGQAVEIGGGFRVPEVMRQSGAKLVDVGTTNRTYI